MAIYTVKSGDTLGGIASKLGISNWRTLYETNKSVIGSNYNLIRPGQKLTYGSTATPSAATLAVAPAVSTATTMGTEAGAAQPLNFGEVLPWAQYFDPALAQGSAEQAYAAYYAPIAQQRQGELESGFAGRGLLRSGLREQSLADLYRELGQEHQKGIESDVLQQKSWAQEDYNRMQELYESSSGKQKPASTAYTPYKVAKPVTDAGTYGSSYLDWLNRVTRV